MDTKITRSLLVLLVATFATPALGAIEGTYSGNFLTGIQGGGAYSYIHEATSAKKVGNAGYAQYAGGPILYAMDASQAISFSVTDVNMNGLDAGDKINLNFSVNLLNFDGTFDGVNSDPTVVGTLTVAGQLTVGGTGAAEHSPSFTNAINNITAADMDAGHSGLSYTVQAGGDTYAGDAFFQSGDLAGPFNGVSYDAGTKTLAFAIWGNSSNMDANGDPNDTGTLNGVAGSPVGMDIYIEAQIVPEAGSLIVWSLLAGVGLTFGRRRAGV